MKQPTAEEYEERITELATFCFRKLAKLEARFVILCERVKAAGIDCSDLQAESFEDSAEVRVKTAPRVIN